MSTTILQGTGPGIKVKTTSDAKSKVTVFTPSHIQTVSLSQNTVIKFAA